MEHVVLLIGGIFGGGATAAVVYTIANRNKTSAETGKLKAETTEILSRIATELAEDVKKDAEAREHEMKRKITSLEIKVDSLSRIITKLVDQIRSLGEEPDIHPHELPHLTGDNDGSNGSSD